MANQNGPGTELRRLRKAHKLTQEELAERIGCSRTLIVHFESGRARPGLDFAVALHRELGLDTSVWAKDRREAVPA